MNNEKMMAANAIRVLCADAVQKANSGHPGLPLGCASVAYELWANHMKHNPANPNWANRDRFILSGGHGSTLLYSLLHLFGYGLTKEDLMQFRQFDSLTPGHPEYRHTKGVEATTGPLGAGMAMAVGMAMAEAHLAAKFNKENFPVVDHYTFVLGGDGCLMEGISSEAFSLAGTLALDKLIVIYDSNKISIEGSTDIAFRENTQQRMESYGFQTLVVEDGNDFDAIGKAIEEAKAEKSKPSFIIVKTQIGYGCPKKMGTAAAHGEPLGEANIAEMKEFLGWPSQEAFFVPEEVYAHYGDIIASKAADEEAWNALFASYCEAYPEMKKAWDDEFNLDIAADLINNEEYWAVVEKADATRNSGGIALNRIKEFVPGLIGGSADLAPSNKSYMNGEGDFSTECKLGRNLHFGVREFAMSAIANGIALSGLRPYIATFFVFSDYCKPMARLASLMKLPVTYVFTHDSIGVGEDGPTHEPIEHLAMWRALPNFNMWRPADMNESLAAWYYAATSKETPNAMALSRQNLPQIGDGKKALKGAYVIADSAKETPDAIIIATGSEVSVALEAKELLAADNVDVRVVSMPCMEVFEAQSAEYKESVLPKNVRARVAVEALSGFGWEKYVGFDGAIVSMTGFGASAPYSKLFPYFGFTKENVAEKVKSVL